ncbi:alpha-2-macroglobulin-like protein 1 isoform X2 [Fukomys damarensis]|uniref:alpha-2-macroglobulin-like protein 1 isoform X2 n=1 Tax=Fukomys damarensis TaxID=885580 RepID=UPI00145541C2|nr:alpha-2-macroglobulin-like protein 1 isoform X2 [Fukomys damarensis]
MKTRNYLVTFPAQLNFPSTQEVCLDLRAGSWQKFTVTMETKDKTQNLLELSGLKKAGLQCISLVVSTDAAISDFLPAPWLLTITV